MLSDVELIRLIDLGESDRVEFTASLDNREKIREAICAFANDLPNHKQSGVIFVGINDDGVCGNCSITDQLLQTLGGMRSDGKIQPFPAMAVDKRNLRGCAVAVVQVEPSDNPPITVDGGCWIRIGPRRGLASSEEERRLTEKRRWGNLPYDMHGVENASLVDLDLRRFEQEYLPAAVSAQAMKQNARQPEDRLRALRLLAKDNMPTVTAILTLGNDPQFYFPGAYIQFVRYDGTEVTDPILDQKIITGTLPDQLRQMDDLLALNISVGLRRGGDIHGEEFSYPRRALQEIVRNAVIHRRYESSNTPVRISWLADRVEITSPGGCYGEVNKENFGQPNATAYRNPTIAEAMKNLGFMERFGIGIATARRDLEQNDSPPLEFQIENAFIQFRIKIRTSK